VDDHNPRSPGDLELKAIVLGSRLMGSVIARDPSNSISVDEEELSAQSPEETGDLSAV